MLQSVPPTVWYRFVAGLNAHLRLVLRGQLRMTFEPVVSWLETIANPTLSCRGIRVDLAWFQPTASGYSQFGLVVQLVKDVQPPGGSVNRCPAPKPQSRYESGIACDFWHGYMNSQVKHPGYSSPTLSSL